jgi:hypothetical protein
MKLRLTQLQNKLKLRLKKPLKVQLKSKNYKKPLHWGFFIGNQLNLLLKSKPLTSLRGAKQRGNPHNIAQKHWITSLRSQ